MRETIKYQFPALLGGTSYIVVKGSGRAWTVETEHMSIPCESLAEAHYVAESKFYALVAQHEEAA